MSTPASSSAARILIVLNWLFAADRLCRAFKLSPSPDAERVIMGLRAVAVLGLIAIPLNYVVLKRLLAIVETVRAGDPFVAANASRLHGVPWALLGLQILSVTIGAIGKAISTPAHPVHLDAGFSISGWLAVLLTFVLARVFAEGTLMREDLVGTVGDGDCRQARRPAPRSADDTDRARGPGRDDPGQPLDP